MILIMEILSGVAPSWKQLNSKTRTAGRNLEEHEKKSEVGWVLFLSMIDFIVLISNQFD